MSRLVVLLIFVFLGSALSAQERITVLVCHTTSQINNIRHHWEWYGRPKAEVVFTIYANQFYPPEQPYCFRGENLVAVTQTVLQHFYVEPEDPIGDLVAIQVSEVETFFHGTLQVLVSVEVPGIAENPSVLFANND